MKNNQISLTAIAIAIAALYSSAAMADTALGANAYVTPGSGNLTVGGILGGGATSTGSSGSTAVGAVLVQAGTTFADGSPSLLLVPTYAYGNQTAIGTGTIAWGTGDSALGSGAIAVSQPVIGTWSSATSLGFRATTWGNNSIAIGTNAVAGPAVAGSAPTTAITITGAIALGANAQASVNNSTAIGTGANAMGISSVALGAGSFAGQDNTVEVGGRRVTGLAAGTAATDAVNLAQLQAAIAGIPGADPTAIIQQANAYTDQSIANLRREYSRAIASVAASPALPSLAAGERAFAVGSGFYNGQQSLGIAYGQALSNRAMVNVSISTAGGMPVSRIGAAWKF